MFANRMDRYAEARSTEERGSREPAHGCTEVVVTGRRGPRIQLPPRRRELAGRNRRWGAPDVGAPVGQGVAVPLGDHLGGHVHPTVADDAHGVVAPTTSPVVGPYEGGVTGESVLRGGRRSWPR